MGLISGDNNLIGQFLKGLKIERIEGKKKKAYSVNKFAEE